MMCSNCSSLSFSYTKKKCVRCKSDTNISIAILCESCSKNDNSCGACLKKINLQPKRNAIGKCRCGG
jgi:hypothetical protein